MIIAETMIRKKRLGCIFREREGEGGGGERWGWVGKIWEDQSIH